MVKEDTQGETQNMGMLYFHVYNRGVDKRDIFCDKQDYSRFLHDLYEFNNTQPAAQNSRQPVGSRTSNNREKIVEVVCFCLMPNHYHLIVGVNDICLLTTYMRKVGTGYTNYFNQKYSRSGHLFQGKYKKISIESDEQLKQLSKYIHLNPLKSKRTRVRSLKEYKYSSYPDYIGIKNIPSILNDAILKSLFKDGREYIKFVEEG